MFFMLFNEQDDVTLNMARKDYFWGCSFMLHVLMRKLLLKGGFLFAPSINNKFFLLLQQC